MHCCCRERKKTHFCSYKISNVLNSNVKKERTMMLEGILKKLNYGNSVPQFVDTIVDSVCEIEDVFHCYLIVLIQSFEIA